MFVSSVRVLVNSVRVPFPSGHPRECSNHQNIKILLNIYTSIPKKGDKSNPLNYRPIAITSLISKTMETIITKQLPTFLETNNLLSDHKYGFQKARSTGDLFAYAVHVWSSALESSGESRVIFQYLQGL